MYPTQAKRRLEWATTLLGLLSWFTYLVSWFIYLVDLLGFIYLVYLVGLFAVG
jgi:hypothetical protein